MEDNRTGPILDEDRVFSTIHYIRELIRDKYNFALITYRWAWLDVPDEEGQDAVLKLNILLQDLFSGGKRDRLEKIETLATVLGWNNGTTTESLWRLYEDGKKRLGRGSAGQMYREVEKEAMRVWQIASTKDLWLAETYALIEALEEEPDAYAALEIIAQNPKRWLPILRRLKPVKRPAAAAFMPAPPPNEEGFVVLPSEPAPAFEEEAPW